MGTPSDLLGTSVVRSSLNVISIQQSAYIQKLATLYDVHDMSPRALLVDPKLHFLKDMRPAMHNSERYTALVGALLHLSNCTRPDIAFAIGVLSR